MKLRRDLVLVQLAADRQASKVELIEQDLDAWLALKGIEEFQRIVKPPKAVGSSGVVVRVGRGTRDVWPGDFVVLDTEAGELVDLQDTDGHRVPHVIVREADISCVIEKGTV